MLNIFICRRIFHSHNNGLIAFIGVLLSYYDIGECNCVNGTAGQYCESYICTEDYCKNGGICTDNSGMLDCICDRDYTGMYLWAIFTWIQFSK